MSPYQCHSWDHKFAISISPSISFTMRKPPYISLERPNHLIDIWDKLRIPPLQLWIFPKIMPRPQIWIQPTSEIEGILPWFISTNQHSLRKGSAPLKGCTERFNAPPKKAMERRRSLTVGRGVFPSKNHFWVVLFMENALYSSSNDFSS